MNNEFQMSLDTQSILLLCGQFGKKRNSSIQPLTTPEYTWLAHWLLEQQMRPADLLGPEVATKLTSLSSQTITVNRLLALLKRQTAMAAALESWNQQGLWILSRSDKMYPSRLKARLGPAAPPLFYGIGDPLLLHKGGLAIIGTRDTNKSVIDFTRRLAKLSAHQGITVISGGAKGVDTEALLTTLAQGRCAIGVLADGLLKAALANKYRNAIEENRLVLISPFDPQIGFNTGNAIARNQYIYTLADWALVVNCDDEPGSVLAGALENLQAGWVPLLVWQEEKISLGNQQLLKQGAIAIDNAMLQHTTDLREQLQLLTHQIRESSAVMQPPTLPLLTPTALEVIEEETVENNLMEETPQLNHLPTVAPSPSTTEPATPIDLFEIVWPYLESQLQTETTEQALIDILNLHPAQLKIWLKRALESGKIRKLNKPVRYLNAHVYSALEKQPALF